MADLEGRHTGWPGLPCLPWAYQLQKETFFGDSLLVESLECHRLKSSRLHRVPGCLTVDRVPHCPPNSRAFAGPQEISRGRKRAAVPAVKLSQSLDRVQAMRAKILQLLPLSA